MALNFEIRNFTQYIKKPTIMDACKASGKKIYFLDAASYNNLGDQAIAYAMSVMLREVSLKYGYKYIEVLENGLLRNLKLLKKVITAEDIICLSGGGNMGNLYPKYESFRRKIIKSFRNNRIIIFPQTIDYDTDSYGQRELRNSSKIYRGHNKLIVCAREKKSYSVMRELYNRVELVPDIVLYLSAEQTTKANTDNGFVGICLRNDRESALSDEQRLFIEDSVKKSGMCINRFTTMADGNVILNSENRGQEVKKKIDEIKKNSIVITDRLHGMIFSILAGVPCIAIDNTNKKLSGVYELVKNTGVNIRFLDKSNMQSISYMINELINADSIRTDMKEMFKNLENMIIAE